MRKAAGAEALNRVRQMRRAPTDAERLLWGALRARRFDGLKFRQQVWIGSYIADFVCVEAQLVVEIDGSQHGEALDYDARRDAELAKANYRTLRFWNNDVTGNLERVLETVRVACAERLPSPSYRLAAAGPSLSPRGESI